MTTTVVTPDVHGDIDGSWCRLFAVTGDVVIYHVDLSRAADRVVDALGLLDQCERSRYERFLYPEPGHRFALCRSALRSILCNWLTCRNGDLSFDVSVYGQPYAVLWGETAPINFSVSHGLNHGLVAVSSKGRVGVDVEEQRPRRNLAGLIETVMSPDEQAYLSGLEENERLFQFYRIWTMKESLVKALGTGMYTDFSKVQVPEALLLGETVSAYSFPDRQDISWTLTDISTPDFAAALAHERARSDQLPENPAPVGQPCA